MRAEREKLARDAVRAWAKLEPIYEQAKGKYDHLALREAGGRMEPSLDGGLRPRGQPFLVGNLHAT